MSGFFYICILLFACLEKGKAAGSGAEARRTEARRTDARRTDARRVNPTSPIPFEDPLIERVLLSALNHRLGRW
ncbi:hypothetical protein KY46_21340 [Photobacterium halotolerans]|uniref:Uncharacterized protein n=1 Tax=Photobacterium halotolerans TaxID=265726 RepID=A0A0F5V708_9GAMM|nr:hypothetical protein KY46_21340 [Photobacterium halotolerans]